MARKQARRRKQKQTRTFRMPSIPVARIVTPVVAILIVVATYHVSGKLLDRPIESIAVSEGDSVKSGQAIAVDGPKAE